MKEIDNFYLDKGEPARSCLQAMRGIILACDSNVSEAWKYSMPFFHYKGKRFCYLWINKKTGQPYLGVVDGKRIIHPKLIQENRSRMKILLLDPEKDLPIKLIQTILQKAIKLTIH